MKGCYNSLQHNEMYDYIDMILCSHDYLITIEQLRNQYLERPVITGHFHGDARKIVVSCCPPSSPEGAVAASSMTLPN